MLSTIAKQRTTVTVDDRRTVFMAARARRDRDIVAIPQEQFVRHMLKERMGWPQKTPAPDSIKAATREIVANLRAAAKEAAAKQEAMKAAAAE